MASLSVYLLFYINILTQSYSYLMYHLVRVGGGYMKFEEFVRKYAQKESIKVIKSMSLHHSEFVSNISPLPSYSYLFCSIAAPGFRATLIRSTNETHVNIIDTISFFPSYFASSLTH